MTKIIEVISYLGVALLLLLAGMWEFEGAEE